MKATELRGILQYVPLFRGRIFVIAIDGSIIRQPAFRRVITDVAVLRSVGIQVVIVHGIAAEVKALSEDLKLLASNLDGTGPTDHNTMYLCNLAAGILSHKILSTMRELGLPAAVPNVVHARRVGIVKGTDYQLTGTIELIDTLTLKNLLENDIVPVLPPLGYNQEDGILRINSDMVAVWAAQALNAVKIIFVTSYDGLTINDKFIRHIQLDEIEKILMDSTVQFYPLEARSKAEAAVVACKRGIPRVHIINGLVDEALLSEVFSKEGVGTLISAEAYITVRKAKAEDVDFIWRLVEPAMAKEELMRRTRTEIYERINDFYILELDRSPVGCVALHLYPEHGCAEIACLCISPSHENQGLGRALIRFMEEEAKKMGFSRIYALSTQAYAYFHQKAGYRFGSPDDLPPARRKIYEESGRKSKVLIKDL